LPPGLEIKLMNAETAIGSLYPIRDAIAQIDLPANNILSPYTLIKDVQCNGIDQQVVIIGVLKKLAPKDLNEAVNVARRISNGWRGAYPEDEPHLACNIFMVDDTDQIFCQIGRYDYDKWATPMLERGGVGKAIYAIKGVCPSGFRMVRVQKHRYLGTIEGGNYKPEDGGREKPFDEANTGVPTP